MKTYWMFFSNGKLLMRFCAESRRDLLAKWHENWNDYPIECGYSPTPVRITEIAPTKKRRKGKGK